MAKPKRWAQKPDGRGGGYSLLPHKLLDSPAYRGLSLRAKALLTGFLRRHNGYNNGVIAFCARQMADELGGANHPSVKAAVAELILAGMIERTVEHPSPSRLADEYRLTFVSSGTERAPAPASNDYADRSPPGGKWVNVEGAKRKRGGNFRVDHGSTEAAPSVDHGSTGRKFSADHGSTAMRSIPHVSVPPSVDHGSTHISYQSPVVGEGVRTSPAGAGDATQSLPALRAWAKDGVAALGYGGQKQIAQSAGISGGTLCKFLQGRGLPACQHYDLQRAISNVIPWQEWEGRSKWA